MTIIEIEDPKANNECKLGSMIVLTFWILVCLTPPTFAIECLCPSYAVRQGKNDTDDVTPRELASGEMVLLRINWI